MVFSGRVVRVAVVVDDVPVKALVNLNVRVEHFKLMQHDFENKE